MQKYAGEKEENMKSSINTVSAAIQFVLGLFILTGHGDLRTIAWYYVISGAIVLILLIIAGLIAVSQKENK